MAPYTALWNKSHQCLQMTKVPDKQHWLTEINCKWLMKGPVYSINHQCLNMTYTRPCTKHKSPMSKMTLKRARYTALCDTNHLVSKWVITGPVHSINHQNLKCLEPHGVTEITKVLMTKGPHKQHCSKLLWPCKQHYVTIMTKVWMTCIGPCKQHCVTIRWPMSKWLIWLTIITKV